MITETLDHFSKFFLVHILSCLRDGNGGEKRFLSQRNYHSESPLSPISALPRADVPLLAYTLKMKTISEESIRCRLGCVNFKIFCIREHKPLVKTQQPIELHPGEIYFFFIVGVKKLLDLIYGPTKSDVCIIISLYFLLPSIETV